MRRFQLMFAACAAALLAAPAPSLAAQPQPDTGAAQATGPQQHHGQRSGHVGQQPTAAGSAAGSGAGEHPTLPRRGPLLRHPESTSGVRHPIPGATGPYPGRHPVAPPVVAHPTQPTFHPPAHRQEHVRPPRLPGIGGWNRALRGHDRDLAGQQWRAQHRGWDANSPWRRDRNWWRHSGGFRLYVGPRAGFFFIPAIGYVAAPSQYQNHYWSVGEYLPSWFWRFVVSDYQAYGLPAPPDGCAWVWVNADLALIDLDDGYILDIVHNAW